MAKQRSHCLADREIFLAFYIQIQYFFFAIVTLSDKDIRIYLKDVY